MTKENKEEDMESIVHLAMDVSGATILWRFIKWRLESNIKFIQQNSPHKLLPNEEMVLLTTMTLLAEEVDRVNLYNKRKNNEKRIAETGE